MPPSGQGLQHCQRLVRDNLSGPAGQLHLGTLEKRTDVTAEPQDFASEGQDGPRTPVALRVRIKDNRTPFRRGQWDGNPLITGQIGAPPQYFGLQVLGQK